MSGPSARLTLADGRDREQVVIQRWWFRIDHSDRRPHGHPLVHLDTDVHDDLLPCGTHQGAADLPGPPGTVRLPAPVSACGEPYLARGRGLRRGGEDLQVRLGGGLGRWAAGGVDGQRDGPSTCGGRRRDEDERGGGVRHAGGDADAVVHRAGQEGQGDGGRVGDEQLAERGSRHRRAVGGPAQPCGGGQGARESGRHLPPGGEWVVGTPAVRPALVRITEAPCLAR